MDTIKRYLAMVAGILFILSGIVIVATSADRGGLPYGVGQAIVGGLLVYWGVSRSHSEREYDN